MANEEVKNPPSHADVFNRMREEKSTQPVIAQVEKKPGDEGYVAPQEENSETKPNGAIATEAKVEEKVPGAKEKPNTDDLSDEELEEIYNKRIGSKKTTPKVLTAQEKEELEKQEETEGIEWAFGTGKIKKDFYDKALVEKSKSKREIALNLFTAELQAEGKNITPEECEEMFRDFYAEEEDEKSWKRKKGLKEINSIADNYLAQYKDLDGITENYRAYKTTAEKQKVYNAQVRSIAKEVPAEISYDIPLKIAEKAYAKFGFKPSGDAAANFAFKVKVDEKTMTQLIKEFTTPEMFAGMGEAKPEAIAQEFNFLARARMMDSIIASIVEQTADHVSEDIFVSLKNSRGVQQPLGSETIKPVAQKAPPSHKAVLDRVK
jgi:hypothetical protein